MSYSNARPIHNLHREIRSTPDDAEPTYSFERESFLASPELEKEDEFHRRLQASYKGTGGGGGGGTGAPAIGGGGSFWRSSSAESAQPVFTSAVQHNGTSIVRSGANSNEAKKNKSAGLLSAALLDGNNKNTNESCSTTVSAS